MTKYLENLSSTNSLVPFNKSFQGQKNNQLKIPMNPMRVVVIFFDFLTFEKKTINAIKCLNINNLNSFLGVPDACYL